MWTVTRQRQWPDGKLVVEISSGNINYTNPGALVAKYRGEMEEYTDPREAVAAAIGIANAWQADCPKETILIDHGATGGMTMPFDGQPLTEETFKDLRDWAEETWLKLDKCDQCGEILGDERYGEEGEYNCCSTYCAEVYYAPVDEDEEIEA